MKKISYLPLLFLLVLAAAISSCQTQPQKDQPFEPKEVIATPERPAGQTDVLELRADPIDTVDVAIIGLGMRGAGAVYRYTFLEGARITAIADIVPEKVEKAQEILVKNGRPKADA
jgi:threonine dehydrogenase-like Zn-dependent dehydrogenase